MTDTAAKPIARFDRGTHQQANENVNALAWFASLLVAAVVQAGGSLDIGYEQMGVAYAHDLVAVQRPDGEGITVRLADR